MITHMQSCAFHSGAMRSHDCDCGAQDAHDLADYRAGRTIETTDPLTRRRVAALAFALRSRVASPTMQPTAAALDIARNAVQALESGDDVYGVVLTTIKYRQQHYGLVCEDPEGAAEVAMGAWYELDDHEQARAKLSRIAELYGEWSGGSGKLGAVETLHAIGEVL